ncbi:MAG: putative peptide zinc metalloprotease protein [Desulforhopalus sp.]|jgi:putative peptide zinc metalloprotease protein
MSYNIAPKIPDQRWDLVAKLTPRLKPHISVHRHHYRGIITYVLEDSITRQRYRFAKSAYEAVGRMTGQYNCEEIYEYLKSNKGHEAATKEIFVEIIVQLAKMEALADSIPEELLGQGYTKAQRQKNSILGQIKKSPLFLRAPLFDPSPILDRFHTSSRPLYSTFFLITLALLFATAFFQLILIWPELTNNVIDRIFTQHNLIILWVLYPVVKTIHEFAHAFTVKHFGGEVTEMGLMLLLFVPVPYVNASDSASFSDKWQRISVAGAGILAELTLAAIALLLFASVEPGLIRTICFNTILICGFSTLFFNGNPLVRFDGYFILSDLIEIPNLAPKSSSFIWYHGVRILTGIEIGKPAQVTPSEKRWFATYGVASFLYRLTIYGSIFYLFASNLGPIGAIIGIIAIAQILVLPFFKRIQPIIRSGIYLSKRKKILSSLALLVTTVTLFICLIPLPYTTISQGVVWQPDENLIKMKSPGIIESIIAIPGERVSQGDLLFECEDPQLSHSILLLESQLKELQLQESAAFASDPFEAKMITEKLTDLSERLSHKKDQENDLTIISPHSGNFIIRSHKELTGRSFKQGETLAFIQDSTSTIRTLISQEDIDPILQDLSDIEISIVSEPGKTFSGSILSENPQSTFLLPSVALGTAGGGKILLNPEDSKQRTTLEKMFQLDIQLDTPLKNSFPESRAYIKYHHGFQPLFFRWIRRVRQLFITKFRG